MSIPPPGPLAYAGQIVIPFTNQTLLTAPPTGDPGPTDNQFSVPTIWVNTDTGNAWILTRKPLGVADWQPITYSLTGGIITINGIYSLGGNFTISAGSGISITSVAPNSITISNSATGIAWVDVTGISQPMAINTGYVSDNPSLVTLTFPATAPFGSIIEIVGKGAGGWKANLSGGQTLSFGNASVTSYVQSNINTDYIRVVCTTANTVWTVTSVIGNPNYS